ncbi:hypothetical protein BDZ94DRAFT_1273082 [Collybia nuda]|uniref:Uncharacterized protein n=1 Tax=Collybia nuda TaxID=64659 RepID=A0A9P5XUX3_9AGAR|nr:hypothetical protein BDZ94DRAFT_1273082 [Collybia nuda]
MQLICFLALFLILPASLATLVNVTVDDELGDDVTGGLITYLPKDAWNSGPTCKRCMTNLDLNQVRNGTWHEGAFGRKRESEDVNIPLIASFSFYGTAVYVYCVLANTQHYPNGNSDLTFFIDHQETGSYTRAPPKDAIEPFEYNVLVFAVDSLLQENHTLTITNGRTDSPESLLILDYIVYSYNSSLPDPIVSYKNGTNTKILLGMQDQSGPPPANPNGKIIGGILGSVACILLILVAFLFRRQQKFKKSHELPAPVSTSDTFLPGEYVRRWFQKTPFSHSPANSHLSFNPNLLVLPIRNRAWSHSRTSPSPIIPRRPKNESHHTSHSHRSIDPVLLAPLPPPTTNRLSPSILDTHTHLAADSGNPLSIAEWRRRTQQEADAIPPRFDMSEVDLSSYYESDSYHSPPPDRPPPKPTVRRFAVVNN